MSLSSLGHIATDREASCAERLVTLHDGIAPSHRHVVYHPLLHVVLVDALAEKLQSILLDLGPFSLLGVGPITEFCLRLVLPEVDLGPEGEGGIKLHLEE